MFRRQLLPHLLEAPAFPHVADLAVCIPARCRSCSPAVTRMAWSTVAGLRLANMIRQVSRARLK
jgi:hypothetical protein